MDRSGRGCDCGSCQVPRISGEVNGMPLLIQHACERWQMKMRSCHEMATGKTKASDGYRAVDGMNYSHDFSSAFQAGAGRGALHGIEPASALKMANQAGEV